MNTIEKRQMLIDTIVGLANGNVFPDEDKPWNIVKDKDQLKEYRESVNEFLKIKNGNELNEMKEFFKSNWKARITGKKYGKSTISDYEILRQELVENASFLCSRQP